MIVSLLCDLSGNGTHLNFFWPAWKWCERDSLFFPSQSMSSFPVSSFHLIQERVLYFGLAVFELGSDVFKSWSLVGLMSVVVRRDPVVCPLSAWIWACRCRRFPCGRGSRSSRRWRSGRGRRGGWGSAARRRASSACRRGRNIRQWHLHGVTSRCFKPSSVDTDLKQFFSIRSLY